MATNPPRTVYEYKQMDTLEEVNQVCREDGFDLFQALSTPQGIRYIVRRTQEPSETRRAGFSGPTGR